MLARWIAFAEEALAATALRCHGRANWPQRVQSSESTLAIGVETGEHDYAAPLLQVCHGAPGVVICAGILPEGCSHTLDALLSDAAELVWEAGPLRKGHGLCHGTAGNGYALLRMFIRSGDERWLARARRFAMHALLQSDALAEARGGRRPSLWTGDLGLATFLWDCVQAQCRFPTLDVV